MSEVTSKGGGAKQQNGMSLNIDEKISIRGELQRFGVPGYLTFKHLVTRNDANRIWNRAVGYCPVGEFLGVVKSRRSFRLASRLN